MRYNISIPEVNNRGFTLIELMISMVIGVVLLTAVYGVFISSSDSYRRLQGLASIQERGRIAINILQDTIRLADYTGCRASVVVRNGLKSPFNYEYSFGQGIEGFDSTGTAWSPTIETSIPSPLAAGGDVITVRGPVGNPVQLTAGMGSDADVLSVPSGSPFVINNIMMITNCSGAADVFQKTDAGGVAVTTVAHSGGENSSTSLGSVYDAGALVTRVETVSFFIRVNTDGMRSLWWKEGAADAQEIIEGVDGMQILYGVTTNTDTSANRYLTAAEVDAAGQWAEVVSVRIGLLIATTGSVLRTLDTDTYNLLGTVYGPFNDYRVRRLFLTNIVLRNRSF
ncbi:PilW family protein [Pseudomonadota bacterium]